MTARCLKVAYGGAVVGWLVECRRCGLWLAGYPTWSDAMDAADIHLWHWQIEQRFGHVLPRVTE